MEVYRRRTAEILRRFLNNGLTYRECVSALATALADLKAENATKQRVPLYILISANNEVVRKEVERRMKLDQGAGPVHSLPRPVLRSSQTLGINHAPGKTTPLGR